MRDDFAVFILTHGRADRVHTFNSILAHGYTGKIFLVIDDEDKTADQYFERYGDKVLMFSKADIASRFDEGDNFNDRRSIFYARNACFDLAKKVGVRFFVELDDDYSGFYYRFDGDGRFGSWKIMSLDWLFANLSEYLESTPFASVAISQGGDHFGGGPGHRSIKGRRKAMNSFVCDVEKPFHFVGRVNEDVNTYTGSQRSGLPFLTFLSPQLIQKQTQSNSGGMTDLYLDSGTYVKTFYSVLYAPSCVKVGILRDPAGKLNNSRIHHDINWHNAAPKIIEERHKKARRS